MSLSSTIFSEIGSIMKQNLCQCEEIAHAARSALCPWIAPIGAG